MPFRWHIGGCYGAVCMGLWRLPVEVCASEQFLLGVIVSYPHHQRNHAPYLLATTHPHTRAQTALCMQSHTHTIVHMPCSAAKSRREATLLRVGLRRDGQDKIDRPACTLGRAHQGKRSPDDTCPSSEWQPLTCHIHGSCMSNLGSSISWTAFLWGVHT